MRSILTTLGAVLLASATFTVAPAAAHSPASEMDEGTPINPPLGYVALCQRDPALCEKVGGSASSAAAQPGAFDDRERMKLLRRVNRYVNRHVAQRADIGTIDSWDRSGTGDDAIGDCEDLAIEKRIRLVDAGLPAQDLYFAIGYQRGIGLHLVLVAHTRRGDYVLDSRTPYINFWSDAPYVWVMRQATDHAGLWRSTLPAAAHSVLPASVPVARGTQS
jgi:predicted transglutaminase-like cysteine proteinase